MLNVALIGGSGGIGAALLASLSEREDIGAIYSTYHSSPAAGSRGSIARFGNHVDLHWAKVDIRSEESIADWMQSIDSIDWLINCAGFLHDLQHSPEKSIRQTNTSAFEQNMAINCLPNLLLAKHAEEKLKNARQGVFAAITAKVGSIEDNRLGGWYSYRASKAAANMVLKTLSIEWQRTLPNVRVLALHPGTTDTNLSKPFQKNVPAHRLFSAERSAGYLLTQIESCHARSTGRFIAYDGEELPW